jgi:glycine/D-amino acid oxidase-like deaminating enzyme
MTDVDIAVVGAGIIGCLVARELVSRSPALSIAVLDRDTAGCGASRRSAGLHLPRGGTRRVRDMAATSQSYYENLLAGNPALPIHPLAMSVLSSESGDRHIREVYLGHANLTCAQDAAENAPYAAARAWHGEGCHYTDVGALVAALTRELRPRVRLREGCGVTSVEQTDAGVTVGLGTGGSLSAAAVVLAPGPWLNSAAWQALLAPLGARVKKIVALHIDRLPGARDRLIVFEDDDSFLLPMPHRGHWLFSYTCQDWDVDPDALRDGLSRRDLAEARDCLSQHAPRLADRVTGGRVFCDAYSASREPIVCALGASGRIVFAGAANGSGYRLAPAIAAETAELLRIEPSRRIDP